MSYDDGVGWTRIDNLLAPAQAAELAADCERLLIAVGEQPELARVGDKPHAGTRRLVDLVDRLPTAAGLMADPTLVTTISAIVGPDHTPTEISYRCPHPGFGGQQLHADDVPRLQPPAAAGAANTVATAIVALVDFTETNGSTRVVPGSNHRPDLQRRSGHLEAHPDEIRLTGPAGTAFVFSGHLLHSGTTNESSAARPALQLVYRAARP